MNDSIENLGTLGQKQIAKIQEEKERKGWEEISRLHVKEKEITDPYLLSLIEKARKEQEEDRKNLYPH